MVSEDRPKLSSASTRWHRYHQESEQERNARYSAIFKRLDVNKDGTICIDDLTEALKTMGTSDPGTAAVSIAQRIQLSSQNVFSPFMTILLFHSTLRVSTDRSSYLNLMRTRMGNWTWWNW